MTRTRRAIPALALAALGAWLAPARPADAQLLLDEHPAETAGADIVDRRGEVKAIAVVAAGGIAAGAATVAALSVAKRSSSRSRTIRRVTGNRDVVASRSFLVDVHVLGR